MKRQVARTLHDYLAMFVRRRWWLVVPFVALAALTLLLAGMITPVYLSETMILIQPRDVPTDFVKDLIAGTTDERLSAIEQTVLSRTNLLKILGEFGGSLTGYRGMNDDRKVVRLKNSIVIEFPSERRRGVFLPTTNFRIAYRDPDPALAQKITARLAALFIEQDSRARENQVFGTREFLEGELAKVATQLHESEGQLKLLKERFRNELPAQLDTNLRTLDRLQIQKTANLEALDRHLSMQMTLERQLSETPPMIFREASSRGQTPGAPPPDPRVEAFRKKEAEYKDLLLRATEDHPDVQRAKAELELLRKELPPQDPAVPTATLSDPAPPVSMPNPVYQSLTAQLQQIRTEIEIREREKKLIEAEMERFTQRVQNTPRVEQEMGMVLRTNAELTKQHEDLKGKLEQAKLAESLESRQKGAQFVIVDQANYPLEPASPVALKFILAGLAASLAAGIAAAWLVDRLDRKIWTQRDLEGLLDAPVLVEVPRMVSRSDEIRARRLKLARALVAVFVAAVYAGGLYLVYLKQNAVMRLLDPLIDRMKG